MSSLTCSEFDRLLFERGFVVTGFSRSLDRLKPVTTNIRGCGGDEGGGDQQGAFRWHGVAPRRWEMVERGSLRRGHSVHCRPMLNEPDDGCK